MTSHNTSYIKYLIPTLKRDSCVFCNQI